MTIYPTDTQRLKAAIYSTGHTPATFAKAAHIAPSTLLRGLQGRGEWRTRTMLAFNESMKSLSPDWEEGDLAKIFFPTSQERQIFKKKPFAVAIIEYLLHTTEEEAAKRAGIPLETLRSLYNACRTPDQLTEAGRVWTAWGLKGRWDGFYMSFLDYPDDEPSIA